MLLLHRGRTFTLLSGGQPALLEVNGLFGMGRRMCSISILYSPLFPEHDQQGIQGSRIDYRLARFYPDFDNLMCSTKQWSTSSYAIRGVLTKSVGPSGGLAAPALAAVAGTALTTVGGAAAATTITGIMGSTVGAAALIAGFGAGGARFVGGKMARRIGE